MRFHGMSTCASLNDFLIVFLKIELTVRVPEGHGLVLKFMRELVEVFAVIIGLV